MTYKDILQKQIYELERKILSCHGEKAELEKQLSKLKLSEFEEDIHDMENQQLLKG